MRYFKNYLFYLINMLGRVDIKREFVTGRGMYGTVRSFNYSRGKIVVSVFDYGMYFPREYNANELESVWRR